MQTASMTRIYKVENIIATCVLTYDWSHPIRVGLARGPRRDFCVERGSPRVARAHCGSN